MADLTIDSAHFLGLMIALWLYGIYTVVFAATLVMMRKRGYLNKIVWGALTALYLLCTGNAVISIARAYRAFITERDPPAEGTIAALNNVRDPLPCVKDIFYAFCILISDGLLLWRLRTIWGRSNYIFGTALFFVATSYVSGLTTTAIEIALALTGDTYKYKHRLDTLSGLTFGLILLSNFTINSLMIGRLWWMQRKMAPALHARSRRLYARIIVAIVESGSLYSVFMLIAVLLYASGATNAVEIPIYCIPAVVGLVPTMMILRLNWKPAMDGPESTTMGDTSASVRWAARTGVTSVGGVNSAIGGNGAAGTQSRLRGTMTQIQTFGRVHELSPDDPVATALGGGSEKDQGNSSSDDEKPDKVVCVEEEEVPQLLVDSNP